MKRWRGKRVLFDFSATQWTPYYLRSRTVFLLVSMLILSSDVDALQVTGGNVTVLQGGTVTMSCKLSDTQESLTQISWQRQTRRYPQNDNFFTILPTNGPLFVNGEDSRFKFVGSLDDSIGNLQLANVTLMDEGIYMCIFTLFPSGNHKTAISLQLLVPPVTSLEDNHLILGEKEVSLVTCTAAGSRPPAEVRWLTGTLSNVRATNTSTPHANGTTTTVSSLFGVPTKEINHHLVQCVITSVALPKEETLSTTIQVNFAPIEVNIRERSKNTFECVAESNPPANFTWTRSNLSWPQHAVRVAGATLNFPSMTSDLNGVYRCEASNPYGKKYDKLYVHTTEGACTACWTLFGLLSFLSVVGLVVCCLHKSGTFPRIFERSERIQTTSCGLSDAQRVEEEEETAERLMQEGCVDK
ncbi:nectin-4 [Pempheris klunzingeri]|uniref:nectin-4 n=1 Tax=Pempheris klunzingeri TaxID=3127111 RepID=UPI0039805007